MARETLLPETSGPSERLENVRNLLFIGSRSLRVWKARLERASSYLPEPRFDEESDMPLNEAARLQAAIDMVVAEHLEGAVEALQDAAEQPADLPPEIYTEDTRPIPTVDCAD